MFLKDYIVAKERIIAKEHELLRVLSFDVQLELPHKYLLNMARCVVTSSPLCLTLLLDLLSPPYLQASEDSSAICSDCLVHAEWRLFVQQMRANEAGSHGCRLLVARIRSPEAACGGSLWATGSQYAPAAFNDQLLVAHV